MWKSWFTKTNKKMSNREQLLKKAHEAFLLYKGQSDSALHKKYSPQSIEDWEDTGLYVNRGPDDSRFLSLEKGEDTLKTTFPFSIKGTLEGKFVTVLHEEALKKENPDSFVRYDYYDNEEELIKIGLTPSYEGRLPSVNITEDYFVFLIYGGCPRHSREYFIMKK